MNDEKWIEWKKIENKKKINNFGQYAKHAEWYKLNYSKLDKKMTVTRGVFIKLDKHDLIREKSHKNHLFN